MAQGHIVRQQFFHGHKLSRNNFSCQLGLPILVFRLLTALGAAVTSASNVAKDCMALTACPAEVLLRLAWLMTVTPDRVDAGGSVPNGAVTKTETETET